METKLLRRRNISFVSEQSVKNGSPAVALGQRCLHTGGDNSACLRLETVFGAKADKHFAGKRRFGGDQIPSRLQDLFSARLQCSCHKRGWLWTSDQQE